jgi:methylated-DNA-protein-cysteine methyltransferase-like protein
MADLSAEARILAAIRAIPRGEIAAYGVVAQRAGLPGRARLVARVLAGNTEPALPWHRVMRAGGRIAFPPGSPGFDEQCRRLRAEGVEVDAGGRVRVATRVRSIDEELWG